MKIGNYSPHYIESGLNAEGNYDIQSKSTAQFVENDPLIRLRRTGANRAKDSDENEVHQYEFIIVPNFGFLGSPDPLIKDCEMKISFDRSKPELVLMKIVDNAADLAQIKIMDCVAITEWVSSPGLRSYFSSIDNRPIVYEYEEIDVNVLSLPANRTNFRLENVKGGNVPIYIFAGIIESDALNGNGELSPTCFERNNIDEFSIMINGSACNGYPISVRNGSPTMAQYKLIETTNRLCNMTCGATPRFSDFAYNWLWSHKVEAEGSQGKNR